MSIKESLNKLKQADLMALFGVTDRTIQRWHDQGLPRHGEGRGCFYVWTEILPWYLAFMSGSMGGGKANERGGKSLSDKDRKLKGEADIEEMKAAEMAGELLRKKDVQATWVAFLSRLNSAMDGYPDRAADQLADGMGLAERVAVLRKEMNLLRRDIVAEAQRAEETDAA